MISYNELLIKTASTFLQSYMIENNISSLTADQCAELLNENGILSNKIGPKPGFNFRQMLRDGRDGKIIKIDGVSQLKPNSRWSIHKI
ncbi:hypothetical protein [Flavobacterium subsaxonicum]|uniref:Uncharacterized protein n=1 Tax=Flavobacterium subsaxonicum WB 4.1-42 = DSM 21790 TaxID=1121898 RepID=A0A0A2MNA0_9FLAO|nr:hypothetical protein [Flavobacterium subsaxonicum]KGO92953.1 hypothetical protein Q766_10010 [Flavobacterium subsaxonicum WB 4.1-42 = DSM 21790]